MFAKSHEDVHKIYDSVDGIKKLSDGIIKIGPINVIGIDGILAFVPIPGLAAGYSTIAGLFILTQGLRARVTPGTWLMSLIVLLIDGGFTTVEELTKLIPVAGPILSMATSGAADAFFQGHLYAAHMIQKDIEKTLYVAGSEYGARQSGEHQGNLEDMRSTKGKKRLVYLG